MPTDTIINVVLGSFCLLMVFLAIGKFRYDTGMSKYSPSYKSEKEEPTL